MAAVLLPQNKGNCLIISKGNIIVVKEATLVNRQFGYLCNRPEFENGREWNDASDHSGLLCIAAFLVRNVKTK